MADFSKTERYRLPTEIEWEWFTKGGNKAIQNNNFNTLYSGSDNLDEVAWYGSNSEGKTQIVGTKKSNDLGLYDCSRNVWEWCYDSVSNGDIHQNKPYIYDSKTSIRRLKGGAWFNSMSSCRISARNSISGRSLGFRIVRTA